MTLDGELGPAAAEALERARWLLRLRWAALAVALAALAAAAALAPPRIVGADRLAGLGLLIAVLAAANAVLHVRVRSGAAAVRDVFASIASDVVAVTVALHLTGGVENPFQVYYVFPVILAGFALSRFQAYAIAGIAAGLFATLGALEYTKLLPHHDVELLPIWRSVGQQTLDQYEDWRYLAGSSIVLLSTLLGACYLATTVAAQLRKNQRELALSKERLEGILRALGEGVAYFDGSGRLVLANESFLKLVPASEGAQLLDAAPAALRSALERALETLRGGAPFVSFEGRDASRALACGLSAVRGAGGVAWVVEDVTQRRLSEERAELERRLVDLGVLAAGIAHEVLNPVAAIGSTAELMESEPGELVRERVGKMRKQIDRITRIVRGVADLARPSGARPVAVALDEILSDAVSRAREERPQGGSVALEIERPAPLAVVAEEPLRVAVKNLVTNALDAAGKEGHVKVRARREGDDAVVEVEDDGPGIADPERIFVPFYTTKPPGSGAGLGLPIAASIVRQHGGKLEVASAPGRGARFTMRLPGRQR